MSPIELLWALMGLIVTIGATWLEVFVATWGWGSGLQFYSLETSFQVGAVLLTSCLGGQNAGAIAQVAYLSLGLLLFQIFELQVFTQGGGLAYLREPSFGYLLGFIPAAWVCGFLAFQWKPKIENLALSCLAGLATVHITGLAYLIGAYLLSWRGDGLGEAVSRYSLLPLPGQLTMICAVAVIAYVLRQLMFY